MGIKLPSTDGRVVTVLGGGVLGRRIACSWAAYGFDVVIRDPSKEQRIGAIHYCQTSFGQYSDKEERGSVSAVEDLAEAVKLAWLVIEAVPENINLKISTFADLEKLAAADAILTSGLIIKRITCLVASSKPPTAPRSRNLIHLAYLRMLLLHKSAAVSAGAS
ncbi:hypothetical protein NQ176_g8254 [Zarea fungicola]|uniref:Uncharacterized protein n=1 Tax=Zarea fungicola TaxID=93591 RepID=A0ACC1MTJ4_9HYPO|nr:hypothetical protein NQ176_g8254 [Lecanicillium fungicola]